jgi:hypothetical protein
MAPTTAEARQLDAQGYTILHGCMSPELRRRLWERVEELFALEGDQAGAEFKQEPGCRRLANLIDKGECFARSSLLPGCLPACMRCLGLGSSSAA